MKIGIKMAVWGFCVACAASVSAQTFKQVADASELEAGCLYVLGCDCKESPDSAYVMAAQTVTGTSARNRKARKIKKDEHGRIRVADNATAVFELVAEGSRYALRDIVAGAWLAYSTAKQDGSSAGLYTLTDEELDAANASRVSWYKTFSISSSGKSFLRTSQKIVISSSNVQPYLLLDPTTPATFRLYRSGDYGDSLIIYKEVVPPSVTGTDTGDWEFAGDWLPDSLYGLDYAQAKRIDFTNLFLPKAGGMAQGGVMPRGHVWTYVRTGQADRLPGGWPNVVEVGSKEDDVPGTAATPIVGGDSCVLGAKYAFRVPAGKGIIWRREAAADGGWYTAGLPFGVETVAWDGPDGEPVALERYAFGGFADGDAVFTEVADGVWQPGVAYLWRPVASGGSSVCFCADEATVLAASQLAETDGFHATLARIDSVDASWPLFLLSADGNRFVRAAEGSWVAPGRGYLWRGETASPVVRLARRPQTTGVANLETQPAAGSMPLYGLDGTRKGTTTSDGRIPADLPAGVYVTPRGTLLKR